MHKSIIRKTLFLVLITLLFTQVIFAQTLSEQSMTILAVSETDDGELFGGTATLTLEIVPGKGRVFIDTFPLTKVDTQISTRSAKQIACDFLDKNCDMLDFIYTIESGSAIIGGPSAGAAMTALTIATLDNEKVRQDVSISGTINPGGIVGSVGGLKEKITAANSHGIQTVLIPSGEAIQKKRPEVITNFDVNVTINNSINQSNETEQEQTNLIEYGESIGTKVIEVSNIYQVLNELTDKEYPYINESIVLPEYYETTMKQIAQQMCERSTAVLETIQLNAFRINNDTTVSIQNKQISFTGNNTVLENSRIDINSTFATATDLQEYGLSAFEFKQYYAAASYCYGTNLNLYFLNELTTPYEELKIKAEETIAEELNLRNYQTITDLQTYMLVQDRINEAQEHFDAAEELYAQNATYDAKNKLITAIERMNSAKQWSLFAKNYGKDYDLSPKVLRESCELKIREAEERYNYIVLYAPFATNLRGGIDKANVFKSVGSYELCLQESSLAKADIDVILAATGVSEEDLPKVVQERIILVEQVILKQIKKDNFPLIGYSYLEYAKSLAQNDPQSSLLYLQYAIELSNIDLYFPSTYAHDQTPIELLNFKNHDIQAVKAQWFVSGMFGALFASIVVRIIFRKQKDKKKSKK